MSDTKRERAARKAERQAADHGRYAARLVLRERPPYTDGNLVNIFVEASMAARYGREALSLRDGSVWTGDCE